MKLSHDEFVLLVEAVQRALKVKAPDAELPTNSKRGVTVEVSRYILEQLEAKLMAGRRPPHRNPRREHRQANRAAYPRQRRWPKGVGRDL